MTDLSYKPMTDSALIEQIGAFIKNHRLQQNKTQSELAKEAGMSRSTLSLLERGESVNLLTLIQALRALDLLHLLQTFKYTPKISPLALAKMQHQSKKRVRKSNNTTTKSDW